jgi:hypothetical protein
MTCINARQRLGSVMMRHIELRADFRPLRPTGTYHAPSRQQHSIGKHLIAAQADGDLAGAIDDRAARLR